MKRIIDILQGALFALGVFFFFLGVMSVTAYLADHLAVTCSK